MTKYVGTWTFGATEEDLRVLRLRVVNAAGEVWGTAMGTGWSPALQIRKVNQTALAETLAGSWTDATEEYAVFAIGQDATLAPSGDARSVDYEAVLVLTKSGASTYVYADADSSPFGFRTQVWP